MTEPTRPPFRAAPDAIPAIPPPRLLWRSLAMWIWMAYIILILAAVPDFFVQYWFNQSLGYFTIFTTNFGTQLALFVGYGALVTLAIHLPVRAHAVSPTLRRASLHIGLWVGIFSGWMLQGHYEELLLWWNGVPFGTQDPVFGRDHGFYIFSLPWIRTVIIYLEALWMIAIVAVLIARFDALQARGTLLRTELSFWGRCGLLATPLLNLLLYAAGITTAAQIYVQKYALLFRDNELSGVRVGAEYLDVVGVVSTVNYIYLSTLIELGLTLVVGVAISRLIAHYAPLAESGRPSSSPLVLRDLVRAGGALLAADLAFFALMVVRDHVYVSPNEPHIQVAYMKHHIDSTMRAYKLDKVRVTEWVPPKESQSVEALLSSKTVQNAPILPGWTSSLEEPPDVQHLRRLEAMDSRWGNLVFGPMLMIYQQQQQLRPYYHFTSVDNARYEINGEKRLFVTAVRELPSLAFLGPKEWLRYWGSAALMFTHGMGLVMSPANEIDELGLPRYASKDVPPKVSHAELEHEPRIYFGEGAKDDYVLTNIRDLKELDYPTEQSRAEFTLPGDVKDGIPVSSIFRRIIFAFHTKDLTAFLFSSYIDTARTKVHLRRTPVLRARSIAPFLFIDTNSFAFIADKKVLWMTNALTVSDMYPYSYREVLGDKADERAIEKFPERRVNYGEDSVKVTLDAYSGEIHFYRMTDDPIVRTWEKVYPDLFEPRTKMPAAVQAQLTYPLQWFHVQFDDIYKRYHMADPIEWYNTEDLWDDADETLGSIGRGLMGFGTTDEMTFSYEGYNLLLDPADLPEGARVGTPGELQYAMLMPFTPESGRNLRSVIIAYQDPEHYGELHSLQIPQGEFVPGPEQIDSYVDNDRPVHQQVTMWIRHNSEVIRGSTLLIPVKGDILYAEPIWVNSLQNDIPQVKTIAVRYKGRITSGLNLAEAIQKRRSFALDELAGTPDGVVEEEEGERPLGVGGPPPGTREGGGPPANLPPQAAGRAGSDGEP